MVSAELRSGPWQPWPDHRARIVAYGTRHVLQSAPVEREEWGWMAEVPHVVASRLQEVEAELVEASRLGYSLASTEAALNNLLGRFESEGLPEDLEAELSSPEKPAALKLYRLLRERVLGLPSAIDSRPYLLRCNACHNQLGEPFAEGDECTMCLGRLELVLEGE
jgi:hypothetical protein